MNHTKIKNSLSALIILLFIGCEGEQGQIGPAGEDGTNGLSSLVNITNEPSGTNCENGGIKVDVGIDNNSNGSLDTDEILATSYVCNGVDGNTSLTSVSTEPAGTNCDNGGLKIDSGVDVDGDGTLNDTEISATAYVCNGIDGNNSITKITSEAAGFNCESGGLKIDSGIDANGDGTLNDTEISATAFVCNGIDGNNSLTKITNEAAGTNCDNGGIKIDTGIDSNSNGALDDSEINATAYTCNGLDGSVSLVNISDEAAGSNCENGGIKIDSGVDDDGDGILDNEEISVTRYVCNGIDGGFDEQIQVIIAAMGPAGAYTGSGTTGRIGGELLDFNKQHYTNVDSIVFVIEAMRVTDGTQTAYLSLYDLSADEVISGTEISTSSTNYVSLKTSNIYSNLPASSIDLGLFLSTSSPSSTVWITKKCYLILYRSN
ncbi:DUF7151 family protein [Marinoscillum pacificum]|uniref:DUF7151 family protein n=1 Tax=Marinoscillum pacificum TaxID=392723 RepID=UPI0021582FF8|nr:hypothetical protein [Marinoscillum pacificum]